MNDAGLAMGPVPGARRTVLAAGLLAIVIAATVALTVAGDGKIPATMAPMLAVAGLWLIWVAPLRKTLMALVFLGLALDRPGDAGDLWQSPVWPLGRLLLENLNKTVNIDALKFSVLMLLIGYLLFLRFNRRRLRSFSDGLVCDQPTETALAAPLKWAICVSLFTAVALCVYGVANGGDLQMAKLQAQTYVMVLLVAYLLAASLRGARDYRTLGTLVVVAACIKAVEAVWVHHLLPHFDYATDHGDSMLFASAAIIVMAAYFERPVRRHAYLLALVLPILLAGMLKNNRRLVWTQLLAEIVVLIAINPQSRVRRAAIRAVAYTLPLLLVYGAVGWRSSAGVFAPVQMIRSMVDSSHEGDEAARSTFYRDVENYNLVHTVKNPLLGTGFGHPFELVAQLDDISSFSDWRYLPHNSLLGLWGFTGIAGFTGLWSTVVIAFLFASRSYHKAKSADERVAAIAAIATMIAYVLHCWGDIGFTEPKGIFLVGPALAIAGQLATSTGAWRRASSQDRRRPCAA